MAWHGKDEKAFKQTESIQRLNLETRLTSDSSLRGSPISLNQQKGSAGTAEDSQPVNEGGGSALRQTCNNTSLSGLCHMRGKKKISGKNMYIVSNVIVIIHNLLSLKHLFSCPPEHFITSYVHYCIVCNPIILLCTAHTVYSYTVYIYTIPTASIRLTVHYSCVSAYCCHYNYNICLKRIKAFSANVSRCKSTPPLSSSSTSTSQSLLQISQTVFTGFKRASPGSTNNKQTQQQGIKMP